MMKKKTMQAVEAKEEFGIEPSKCKQPVFSLKSRDDLLKQLESSPPRKMTIKFGRENVGAHDGYGGDGERSHIFADRTVLLCKGSFG